MIARTIRRSLACVALGAGIAAAVLHAPPAHADSSSFLDSIHELGWYNRVSGDVGLLNQGYAVCAAMDDGANGVQVARAIYANTDLSVSIDDAGEFVIVAVENLCPYHDHRSQDIA